MGSQVRWTYDQNRSSSGLPSEGFSLNLTLDVTRTSDTSGVESG